MSDSPKSETPQGAVETKSPKAKALSARLSAVQALYQYSQNKQPMRVLFDEYMRHRTSMEIDGEKLVQPDGTLLKKILYGVEERKIELESVIDANLKKDAEDRKVEPLLRAILICGAYELLIQEFDSPIIINDYLNVAHTFYERNEVGLINGVLDQVASMFR